jgi:hypothetical protein
MRVDETAINCDTVAPEERISKAFKQVFIFDISSDAVDATFVVE